jgi:hypothetical protein
LVASRLNYAGYTAHTSAASQQDYGSSMLIDYTSTQDASAREALLSGLGLDSAGITSSPDPKSPVQYRLIIGSDYKPCFQPQDLSH